MRDLRRRARRDDPLHRHQRGRDRRLADHVRDGELPAAAVVFRKLHPRFKTPWLALVVFAGIFPILAILPGRDNFVGNDVRVRRDALVHDRARRPDRLRYRSGTRRCSSSRSRISAGAGWTGRSSRSSAGIGTLIAWLVIVLQDAADPLGRLRLARVRVHRLRDLPAPVRPGLADRDGACAGHRAGAPLEVAFRTIVVPVSAHSRVGGGALRRRSARRRSPLPDRARQRDRGAARASAGRDHGRGRKRGRAGARHREALLESYGVRTVTRVIRASAAGPAIVEDALAPRTPS